MGTNQEETDKAFYIVASAVIVLYFIASIVARL